MNPSFIFFRRFFFGGVLLALLFSSRGGFGQSNVDAAGAEKFLRQFVVANADLKTLNHNLRPSTQDYQAVFIGEAAKRAEEGYKEPWDRGEIVIQPNRNQTELVIWYVTAEELKKGKGANSNFPQGYEKIAPSLKDGIVFYRFKYLAPGEKISPTWDGLVFVNGHWVLFPQPWRVL